ncbi:MAG: cupin domain-containing protein [Spirochaetota bacterium]|nr:cupin domain-containing protein [Spirochaetota bacterium]
MKTITASDIINRYNLIPHPEGGYYRETYRSNGIISKNSLPKTFKGDRVYSTAIYFLLPEESKSSLHCLPSDECWHFYLGGPLTIVTINPNGKVEKTLLGQDINDGQTLQHFVEGGHWLGAYPNTGSKFSFVGCTTAPGFDFSDFTMGKRSELIKLFPNAKEIIIKLTEPTDFEF